MATLWIDIETIPGNVKPDVEDVQVPSNYKDPVKIEAYQRDNQDKAWRSQALDSMAGQVLSIAWADGNAPAVCFGAWEGRTEYDVLAELNNAVEHISTTTDSQIVWGGFNLKSFDLTWLYHKALKYDLDALVDNIQRTRYPKNVLDIRDYWTGGDSNGKGKLKDIAKLLGIETMDMDGSEVFDLYLAGEFAKIETYNKHDVDITRTIAWRMGLIDRPIINVIPKLQALEPQPTN